MWGIFAHSFDFSKIISLKFSTESIIISIADFNCKALAGCVVSALVLNLFIWVPASLLTTSSNAVLIAIIS